MKKTTSVILSSILLLGVSVQAYANQESRGPRERPVFSDVDTDGNGEISLSEFSSQDLPGGDADQIFNSIDTDQDGVISEQEFSDHKPPAPPQR